MLPSSEERRHYLGLDGQEQQTTLLQKFQNNQKILGGRNFFS